MWKVRSTEDGAMKILKMMKKRKTAALAALLAAAGLFSGCGSADGSSATSGETVGESVTAGSLLADSSEEAAAENTAGRKYSENVEDHTLTVLGYGEYTDYDILDIFEEETGIKVLYEEATLPEEMYTKYMSGAIDYDLICTSDYMIEKLLLEGELLPIDWDSMPDSENLGDIYMNLCQVFDPTNEYTMPYFWGTVGILYNKSMTGDEITSWDDLFNGKYAGDILMQNSIRDCYMVPLKYLGYSLNTTDKNEIDQAQELLIRQKPDVEAYFVDEVREEMVAGNAAVSVCYSGEAYLAHEYDENLEYVVPEEGTNLWIDAYCMTRRCHNTDYAQQFLDFLCREDIAMMNFEEVYYPTPNTAVYDQLDEETQQDPLIFPSEEAIANCEVYKTLDTETTDYYSRLWKLLKVS